MKKPYDKPCAGFVSFRPEERLNTSITGDLGNNPFPYSDESINDSSSYRLTNQ